MNGHSNVVRQLYQWKPSINISAKKEWSFRYACKFGHLEIVRQLYQWKPTIDISAKDEYAFRLSCRTGKIEVVRQLYQWKPTIDISAWDEYAFRWACENGRLEIVRQLYQWKPTILSPLTKESIPEGETLECPICRDNIHGECMVTKCGHKYCAYCINQWLENSPTCPYCRRNI